MPENTTPTLSQLKVNPATGALYSFIFEILTKKKNTGIIPNFRKKEYSITVPQLLGLISTIFLRCFFLTVSMMCNFLFDERHFNLENTLGKNYHLSVRDDWL